VRGRRARQHLRLRFRFSTRDLLSGLVTIARSRAGAIAVSNRNQALPCGLATGTCAARPALGLVACVDEISR
jgi:hypothetical protein